MELLSDKIRDQREQNESEVDRMQQLPENAMNMQGMSEAGRFSSEFILKSFQSELKFNLET